MAATKAMNLYITTCRYVIQSNPYDPETWSELYRYLPYLRQSLSCCVCAQYLHIPMGPVDSPCQHHVCQGCIGGKMRLKPTCAWCNNYAEFVENPILRTVIQCVKKLCEYLASSGIAVNLSNTNNGGNATLMTAIQDGLDIKDDCNTFTAGHLGPFPPTLHKVVSRRGSKEETNRQFERQVSISDKAEKGEGHQTGIISSTNCEVFGEGQETVETGENGSTPEDRPECIPRLEKEPVQAKPDVKRRKRKRSGKLKCNELPMLKSENDVKKEQDCDSTMPDIQNDGRSVHELYETVASEHDYNKDASVDNKQNSIPKVRIRKVEGDHESLVRKTRTVPDPVLPCVLGPLSDTTDSVTNGSLIIDDSDHSPLNDSMNVNNNSQVKDNFYNSSTEKTSRNRLSLNKKKHIGCRCGLATPNPGKLTCCGQRCPCYSAFKGCVDCRCRGCRNPRGDTPSPHSLKSQLQSQCIQSQTLINLGANPQIILTPVKVERDEQHENNVDMEVDD